MLSYKIKCLLLSLTTASFLACKSEVPPKKEPNIIFLLTDDQRWDALGAMGNKIIQTPHLDDLANKGVRVIVAGLDMDFKGNPFGPMPNLMATAEYVTKVHAVCTRTGNLAQYSYRKSKSDDLVLVGEVEDYEPLSRAAYYKATMRDKVRNMSVNDAEEINSKTKDKDA